MHANSFVGNVSLWDTSSATTMEAMFASARNFNGYLTHWDVSRVRTMAYMFFFTRKFEGEDLTQWNVGRVESMASMFRSASVFNGNVTIWDTRSLYAKASIVRVQRVAFLVTSAAAQLILSHAPGATGSLMLQSGIMVTTEFATWINYLLKRMPLLEEIYQWNTINVEDIFDPKPYSFGISHVPKVEPFSVCLSTVAQSVPAF
jgi:Mycoplasma protein of unknown function, DUF285